MDNNYIPFPKEVKQVPGEKANGPQKVGIKYEDGTVLVREATGQLRKIQDGEKVDHMVVAPGAKKVDWRKMGQQAGKAFMAMVDERKKIQQLILDACIQIRTKVLDEHKIDLNDYAEFRDISFFARGVPRVEIEPIETLRLDGVRAIKRILSHSVNVELFLECGHVIDVIKADDGLKDEAERMARKNINDVVSCSRCVEILKAKGLYHVEEKVGAQAVDGTGGGHADSPGKA